MYFLKQNKELYYFGFTRVDRRVQHILSIKERYRKENIHRDSLSGANKSLKVQQKEGTVVEIISVSYSHLRAH